ncbi:hypothetical protein ACQWU4_09270 [Chryseobacterium sp. MIQD13]|uniref:hypothetical protein n=1 Tax=Chryseobacterium sp. MIQD13 TaxID=3422310 RepID=UPI003D2C5CE6
MKTKQELKQFFENGDIPNQEQFWEWQDSYWHKDEKIPSDKLDYDFSKKADLVNGQVPASQLPSYVDDVLEFASQTELPSTGEPGKIYITTDNNKQYRWSGSSYAQMLSSESQDLNSIVSNGNYAPRFISFIPENVQNTTEGSRHSALGANSATYSFFFGNMNPAHTGIYNTSFGYNSLPNITTGQYNTATGHFSGQDLTTGGTNTLMGTESGYGLTTGNENTLVGVASGYGIKTGSGNAFLGKWTGSFIAGNNNTFLGYQAGQFWGRGGSGLWSSNIVIGGGTSGHSNGIWGENNVIIGSNLELIGNNSNRFIINNYLAKANRWYNTHFIEGNFADRWLRFDTSLQVLRLPQADTTFTRNIVAKPDGTFGWTDQLPSEGIPLSGTKPNAPVSGSLEFMTALPEESTLLYRNNPDTGVKSEIGFHPESMTLTSTNSDMHMEMARIEVTNDGINMASGSSKLTLERERGSFMTYDREKGIIIDSDPDSPVTIKHFSSTSSTKPRGLTGMYDYSKNLEGLDYIQKVYADRQHSYTTKEEETGGTWINGKPVYKKTLFLDQIPRTGEIDLIPDFPDVETIVSNQMFTEWYALDVAFAGNQWRTKAFITVEKDKAIIELSGTSDYDYSLINSFTLTLEYTKK